MGKLSKEECARYSGADWMIDFVKKHGLEAAEKELETRGIRHMPLAIKDSDIKEFIEREKNNTKATVLMLAVKVLFDEFEFDSDNMNRFITRFNHEAECIVGDFVSWKDLQKIILDEAGILIPISEDFMEE